MQAIFNEFIHNAALMITLGVAYTALKNRSETVAWKVVSGIILGLVTIAVMLNPFVLMPGVIFDTRAIVLAVGGMFLGLVPAFIAALFGVFFRVYVGGPGVLTGSLWVIVASLWGLIWLKVRKRPASKISGKEYYLLGFTLSIVLLLLMFTMPNNLALPALKKITLPILVIFPFATMLLAWLFTIIEIRRDNVRAVQESEERFRALSEASHGGVVIHDKGLILECNEGLVQMTGYSRDELIGMDGYQIFEPKSLDIIINKVSMGYTERYEATGVRKEGTVYPLSIKGKKGQYKGREVRIVELFDLTEIKQAEKRFQDIATNLGDWIWEIDLDGKYTYASERIEDILGYKAEEVIGETVVSLMPEQSSRAGKKFFRELLKEQRPFKDFESWFYHKKGRLVCLSTSGTPVFDKTGELLGYRGVDKNITEKKREENLRLLRLGLDNAAENHGLEDLFPMILEKAEHITDSQISFFHFVEEDQEHLRLQAWSKATLENFCRAEGFDRHYPISKAGVWTDCIREKQPVIHNDYENLARKHDLPEGHAHVIRELVVPIIRGGVVKGILGVGNKPFDYDEWDSNALDRFVNHAWEILEWKRTDEHLKKTIDVLYEIQRIGKIGTWELDFIKGNHSWSTENCEIFGVPENTNPSQKLFLEKVHPDDRQKVIEHYGEALKTGSYDIEYRLLIDDQIKWVHGKANFKIEDDKAVSALGFTQDITEKKQLQESQMRASQLSALGEVAAGVAHEINNPINGVINYAQLLINKNDKTDKANEILGRIIREGTRISSIVKNLLNFAQKDSGKFSLLDVADIVVEPLNLMSQMFKSDGIFIDVGIPEDLPLVYGNQMQLEQVILNLLGNARHALNKKYPDPSIEKYILINAKSSKKVNGGSVFLTVKDFGCGIPEENLGKLFTPFFTTKEAGVGTGLGLSVCHEILEKHNAVIVIDSNIGKFTEVTITFPCKTQ